MYGTPDGPICFCLNQLKKIYTFFFHCRINWIQYLISMTHKLMVFFFFSKKSARNINPNQEYLFQNLHLKSDLYYISNNGLFKMIKYHFFWIVVLNLDFFLIFRGGLGSTWIYPPTSIFIFPREKKIQSLSYK